MHRGLLCIVLSSIALIAGQAQGAFEELRAADDRDAYSVSGGPWVFREPGIGSLIIGSGWSSLQHEWRSAMEFPLAPVQGIVTKAELTFWQEVVSNPPAAYSVHGYLGDGVIALADLLVDNRIGPIRTTNEPYRINVTEFVQSAVDARATHAGFLFRGFPGGSGLAIRSSEPYANAPLLSVTFTVPEPATAAVCAIAGLLLQMYRRRR